MNEVRSDKNNLLALLEEWNKVLAVEKLSIIISDGNIYTRVSVTVYSK